MKRFMLNTLSSTLILAVAQTLGAFTSPLFAMTPTTLKSGYEVIVSATPGGSTQEIESVLKSPMVSNVRFVFSPDEQRMLRSIGRIALAEARKFTLKDETDYARLNEQVVRAKWRVKLEPAEIRFLVSQPLPQTTPQTGMGDTKPVGLSAKFDNLLWGMKNIGQQIAIALDDLTSDIVQGIKGEDIGLDRAPKENSDPSKRITIAVLDSGVDFGHPEMADQLYENVAECKALAQHTKCLKDAGALQGASASAIAEAKKQCDQQYLGKDFDGNGYPLDCSGWNLTVKGAAGSNVWGDNDARDTIGHGTHIAGILSATNKDGDGVFGVIQNSRILPVKVITASPTEPVRPAEVGVISNPATVGIPSVSTTLPAPDEGSLKAERGLGDLVARGILYSLRSGAQIINMSLGWPADVDSNLMSQMIDLARSRGVLVVAAAGNDGTDALIRPCIFEGVICVASHDPDGAISHFSNHGAGVDIAAPGLGILSIFPTSLTSRIFTDRVGYEQKNGTSMAAPYVAGILARLLNAGYSASEAQARLLAGVRPVKTNPRVSRSKQMLVQTGNADLGLAFKAAPRPLILPTTKKPLLAKWNRLDRTISVSLELQNQWAKARSVTIRPDVVEQSGLPREAVVNQREIRVSGWPQGEKRTLPLEITIQSTRLDSELLIALEIESQDEKSGKTTTDTRHIAVEIVALPSAGDREIENKPFSGDIQLISLVPKSSLRTIQNLDGAINQDYMAINTAGSKTKLILMRETSGAFNLENSHEMATPQGSLLVLQRLDLNGDGVSDYALVWKQAPSAAARYPIFTFRFFDSNLKPLALEFDGKTATEASYGNTISVITDKFQWISVGKRRFPAWISRGTTPESEKPAYDPWNPTPIDLPSFRFYVWGDQGLKTIKLEDKTPIAFFPPSREDLKSGRLKALWVTGTGTDQVYEVSEVYDMTVRSIREADFGGVRSIRPTMIAPVYDLSQSQANGSGEVVGAAFSSESYRAAQRVTGFSLKHGVLYDSILNPISKTDAVVAVLAGFADPAKKTSTTTITQTIYEMQVHETRVDGSKGVVTSTSLKKFSFMPGFFFQKLFFPIVGGDSVSGGRLPMVYLAQGFGTGIAMEVTAVRQERGKVLGLTRPARLRLITPNGCESMGDPLEAHATGPARVAYICADRVMFVPMTY